MWQIEQFQLTSDVAETRLWKCAKTEPRAPLPPHPHCTLQNLGTYISFHQPASSKSQNKKCSPTRMAKTLLGLGQKEGSY